MTSQDAKIQAALDLVENSPSWRHGVWWSDVLSRRAENRRVITKLVKRHEFYGVPIAMDWSFLTCRSLFNDRSYGEVGQWTWFVRSTNRWSDGDFEVWIRIWQLITDHEPNTEERERMDYSRKLCQHLMRVHPDGTFDLGRSKPASVPDRQRRFDELTAAHNAQLEAKLARDAFRAAVALENIGRMPDDLINLIGSFYTGAIIFHDGPAPPAASS